MCRENHITEVVINNAGIELLLWVCDVVFSWEAFIVCIVIADDFHGEHVIALVNEVEEFFREIYAEATHEGEKCAAVHAFLVD